MSLFINVVSAISIVCCILSCSSPYTMRAQEVSSETQQLQEYCQEKRIQSAFKEQADSLFTVSRTFMQKGKSEETFFTSQLAQTLYRLALSEYQLVQSNYKIATLEKKLKELEDELHTYKKVLHELQTIKE